jgi:serine/threonine-protein kinase
VTQPRTLGKYRILDVLGSGGMGTVYRALDPALERTVAIKLLHSQPHSTSGSDDIWGRFRNEARAVARLNHPAIVSVYDFSEAEPHGAFFVMEYVDGVTLEHYLHGRTQVSLAHSIEMIVQLLAGLGYAHAQGVVHRDVKPSNILITGDGRIKVTDFGIAKVGTLKQTQTGFLVGTPQYMAPEQYRGSAVDHRCDLHAVGVLLFQVLTGRAPFAGPPSEVMYQVCNAIPVSVSRANPSVPALLDPVVARSLAKDPDDRFQSAREFSGALTAARSALGLTAAMSLHGPATSSDSGAPPPQMSDDSMAAESRTVRAVGADRTPPAGSDTLPPIGWFPEQLAEVERLLIPILGPMARIVVKRAAALTADLPSLYRELAGQLRSDEERERFLGGVSSNLRMRISAHGTASKSADRPRDHGIAAATCERAARLLARYVGPIAPVIVKKAASVSLDEADLYEQLGARIADDRDRARFMAELSGST